MCMATTLLIVLLTMIIAAGTKDSLCLWVVTAGILYKKQYVGRSGSWDLLVESGKVGDWLVREVSSWDGEAREDMWCAGPWGSDPNEPDEDSQVKVSPSWESRVYVFSGFEDSLICIIRGVF